jgi:hypothetical protein
MTSAEVRNRLVHALGLDQIGPDRALDLRDAVLPTGWPLSPSNPGRLPGVV